MNESVEKSNAVWEYEIDAKLKDFPKRRLDTEEINAEQRRTHAHAWRVSRCVYRWDIFLHRRTAGIRLHGGHEEPSVACILFPMLQYRVVVSRLFGIGSDVFSNRLFIGFLFRFTVVNVKILYRRYRGKFPTRSFSFIKNSTANFY